MATDAEDRLTIIPSTPAMPAMGILRPLVSVQLAVQYWREYQDLCRKLLTEDDYQKIGQRAYKKKSAWRKLSNAFGLSTEVVSNLILHEQIDDPTSPTVLAEFTVKVTAPNGRSAMGWGACSVHEERGFTKPDHDIPSTAMTRSINRAVSDLIGAGEVSAEEMSGERPDRPERPEPTERQVARAAAGGAPLATPAQIGAIQAMARKWQLTDSQLHAAVDAKYHKASLKDLTKQEASACIDSLRDNGSIGAAVAARRPATQPEAAPDEAEPTEPQP